jgi:Raf kinase inhibitor-like YbhB/YbcL family protein
MKAPDQNNSLLFRAGTRRFKSARTLAFAVLLNPAAFLGCRQAAQDVVAGGPPSLQLTSPSFHDGAIPRAYTCDGSDTSPKLSWTAPPATTKSLALIVIDPDAPQGTFVHWVLYNLPPSTRELPEGLPAQPQLPDGSRHGLNDFPKIGYGGPCPPKNSRHRYRFILYAVDTKLDLPSGISRKQVEEALKGHILAYGELRALYGR